MLLSHITNLCNSHADSLPDDSRIMSQVWRKVTGIYHSHSSIQVYIFRCQDPGRCLFNVKSDCVGFRRVSLSLRLYLQSIRENSTSIQRDIHENDIISMVRTSLVDDEANVRSAAAKAFDILQEHLGVKAIDQTIPTLLEALRQPGKASGTALQALREIMNVRDT